MTITFADGTRLEVPASAWDDFVKHDLTWVEFVHGHAATQPLAQRLAQPPADPPPQSAHCCPARTC